MDFQRTVLVTGASRGIGAACAEKLAAQGWDVAVNFARDEASATRVAAAVRAHGRRALVLRADVGDEAATLAMFARIDAEWGPLGGLVNNAGIVDMQSRLEDMDTARWRRMLDVNVIGTLLCAREAVRRMSTRRGGRGGAIVNLSSAAAVLGGPGLYVDYAASKGAIDSFTTGLGREVAADGIRVNAVRPGIIDTEIHAASGDPNRAASAAGVVPMKRPGTAMECANAVAWLLSDEASYVTGTVVTVSGGR
ncbi:MAG: SDR family oxidoreductase [Alphaproteobacteria bacterium]|jgi:NAD(P)-dependent dehydrogenase (short-subunit alcohol dehydrogenase family)